MSAYELYKRDKSQLMKSESLEPGQYKNVYHPQYLKDESRRSLGSIHGQ
jgi:hypothetical protein